MKKIDLHIHTISTVSDYDFEFSMDKLVQYVTDSEIDGLAITNHNLFDKIQYLEIQSKISKPIFPGIEIDLRTGHLLVICDPNDVVEFDEKCKRLAPLIKTEKDFITVEKLFEIFGDLNKYLLIPHYQKHPSVSGDELEKIRPFVSAGEVDSPKKFIRQGKIEQELTPVLFSDARFSIDMKKMPTRHTYIHCGDLSIKSIKGALRDRTKVTLSKTNKNKLFQEFEDGQVISSGLNIIYGQRSSGKTVALSRIAENYQNAKYIKQFQLVQASDEEDEKLFNSEIQKRRSGFVEDYIAGFRNIVDDIKKVNIDTDIHSIEKYLSTLKKSAEEADRKDAFSKVNLFNEAPFDVQKTKVLKDLIGSTIQLIENNDYKQIIEKHVEINSLKKLAIELIELLWEKSLTNKMQVSANSILADIQDRLHLNTSATRVFPINLYELAMHRKKIEKFNYIVQGLQQPKVIFEEFVQGFQVIAQKEPFTSAEQLNEAIKGRTSFKDALKIYGNPFEYLKLLEENEKISESELPKLFAKISYRILNKGGTDISGGERSEFRLLQAIKDAQLFDILLIDEPESSFDNKFLNADVNRILKDISMETPVVVVTHNNSIGASINPDYLLFAEKTTVNKKNIFRLYAGYPTDPQLKSMDGQTVNTYDVFMNSLEAGEDAYSRRGGIYEAVKS
jgi:acetolactate synthase small subunit